MEIDQIVNEEIPVDEVPAAPKKKRQPPALKRASVDIRTINGEERFVCSWTNRLIERRIFVPSAPKAGSFCNVPCAVAYIRENARDDKVAAQLISELAEFYEQPNDDLPCALERKRLDTFGGALPYAQWNADFAQWDELTDLKGESVEEYKKSGGRRNKKRKRTSAKPKRCTLEAKSYLLRYQGYTETHIVDDAKKADPSHVARQIDRFARKLKEQAALAAVNVVNHDDYMMIGLVNVGGDNAKLGNALAHAISGNVFYGPVILLAKRKFSFELPKQ